MLLYHQTQNFFVEKVQKAQSDFDYQESRKKQYNDKIDLAHGLKKKDSDDEVDPENKDGKN